MTYNQTLTLLENIALAHKFVKSFGDGEAWEINSVDRFKDYTIWIIPVDSGTLTNTKNRTFTLLVFRRVDKAKRFEREILSNCEQIFDDFVKTLRNHSNDFDLIGDPIAFPFKEEFGDWCAGWRGDIVIETKFANNYCDVPSDEFVSPTPNNNASYIIDEGGNVVYTLYPGQTFIQQTMAPETAETFTVVNNTVTLSHIPTFVTGFFLNGVRLELGQKLVSIVGNVLTLDDDYTGYTLTAVYNY